MDSKVFALIGDPVEGTLSPMMMNAAFRSLGLNHAYVAVRVPGKLLADAVVGLRKMDIAGLNVTIPHKVSVITLLDGLDESAALVGAVNTIKNTRGKLIGFNTDGEGALRNLESRSVKVKGKRILLLGSGGAARAIAFSVAEAGADLTIANRTAARATELALTIEDKLGIKAKPMPLNRAKIKEAVKGSDILVNTTSVGMRPKENRTLVTSDMMHGDLIVFDIVYKPLRTRLLREAERAGAKTVEGLGMLVQQAALALEIWTGKKAPVKVMEAAARNELRRRAK